MVSKGLLCFIFIPIILSGLFYFFLIKQTSSLSHRSLKSQVKIQKDQLGIPHIYSDNLQDLYFGMGYAVAQDRLWQMDLTRRVAQGKISELLGQKGFQADLFFRNIRLSFHGKRLLSQQEPQSLSFLQRYADGVNFYRQTHFLPLEYWIIWGDFQQWKTIDSYMQGLLIGLGLNLHWSLDLMISYLESQIGQQAKDLFMFGKPRKINPTIADFELSQELKGDPPLFKEVPTFEEIKMFAPPFQAQGASNSWAISGKHTKSGKPLIANDPHLSNSIPTFWHTVSLHYKDNYFTLMTSPGAGLSLVGRSKYIATTATSLKFDQIDIFQEKIEGNFAFYDGQKYELTTFYQTINIKGKQPVTVEFKLSKNGPILMQNQKAPGMIGYIFSQSTLISNLSFKAWFAHTHDFSYNILSKIFEIKTVYQLREALKLVNIGALDIVMADSQGNIAYQAVGNLPRRKARANGILPGWSSQFTWEGFIPFQQNPFIINPPKGYLITANGFPVTENYKHFKHMGPFFFNSRMERLSILFQQQISQGKKFDMEDMVRFQLDYGDSHAQHLLPILLGFISNTEKNQQAVTLLKNWDYFLSPDSYSAALYQSWIHYISSDLISDRIQDYSVVQALLKNVYFLESLQQIFKNQEKSKNWCDDKRTEKLQTCQQFLSLTLEKAVKESQNKTWGELHHVIVKHSPFHANEYLRKIFSLEIPNMGGSYFTPNANTHPNTGSLQERYKAIKGPNLRVIYDMSPNGDFYQCMQAGNSGNIMSKHYSDQAENFHKGKYFKGSQIEQGKEVTILSPVLNQNSDFNNFSI